MSWANEKGVDFRRSRRGRYPLSLADCSIVVGQLLFGEEFVGVTMPIARVLGCALIALGIACWPGPPLVSIFSYSALVTLYLVYLGFAGGLTGILLWPVVVLHMILTVFLVREVVRMQRD